MKRKIVKSDEECKSKFIKDDKIKDKNNDKDIYKHSFQAKLLEKKSDIKQLKKVCYDITIIHHMDEYVYAKSIHECLKKRGLNIWISKQECKLGLLISTIINKSLKSDVILVVLTENLLCDWNFSNFWKDALYNYKGILIPYWVGVDKKTKDKELIFSDMNGLTDKVSIDEINNKLIKLINK